MQDGVEKRLQGRRVLIVEDEMLIAMELESLLAEQGCTAVGPAPTAARATALLSQERLDAAILDINLDGEDAMPVATALTAQGVPFVLATGYSEAQSLHPELKGVPRIDKPVQHEKLVSTLVRIIGGAGKA